MNYSGAVSLSWHIQCSTERKPAQARQCDWGFCFYSTFGPTEWRTVGLLPCPGESGRWLWSPGSWVAGRSCRPPRQTPSGTSAYSAESAQCTSCPHLVGRLSCMATGEKYIFCILSRLDYTWTTTEAQRLNSRLSSGPNGKQRRYTTLCSSNGWNCRS